MLTDSDLQKLKRYVDLAPYMTLEQSQALLERIRKLKAIEAAEQGSWLPESAVSDLAKCVDDKLMRDIVNDQRHGVGTPGWLPPGNPRPVERGSGWQSPPKPEEALRWSRVSLDAADGGVKKYMHEYYEFPKFCERVAGFIQSQGGFVSDRELRRAFRRHMRYGNELEKATAQLEREGVIQRDYRKGERGPAAEGWRVVV